MRSTEVSNRFENMYSINFLSTVFLINKAPARKANFCVLDQMQARPREEQENCTNGTLHYRSVLRLGDLLLVDKPPVARKTEIETNHKIPFTKAGCKQGQHLLRFLNPNHTVLIETREMHKKVSIDRVTRPSNNKRAGAIKSYNRRNLR